jgi:hypothetical protein
MEITVVSGHYPNNIFFANRTKELLKNYCIHNKYNFFYDNNKNISEYDIHHLHYRRCISLIDAYNKYPNTTWLVWLDSDIYVNKNDKIENIIDLNDTNILYHLFHEKPWIYPINTGVKIVNKNALIYEKEIYNLRNTKPYNEFPYEQKTLAEYILPKIKNKYIIHDPYIMNCIVKLYPNKLNDALFIHMCNMSKTERNIFIIKQLLLKYLFYIFIIIIFIIIFIIMNKKLYI